MAEGPTGIGRPIVVSEGAWTKGSAVFNGIIALANVCVATLIYFQLQEMKSSSVQMDKAIGAAEKSASAAEASALEARLSNQMQLRPIVSAKFGTYSIDVDDLSKWYVKVNYTNIGKAAALSAVSYGALAIYPFPLPDGFTDGNLDYEMDNERSPGYIIMPGETSTVDLKFGPTPNINAIKKSNVRFYAMGHIRYLDANGGVHHTSYCASYSWEAVLALRTGKAAALAGLNCEGLQKAD